MSVSVSVLISVSVYLWVDLCASYITILLKGSGLLLFDLQDISSTTVAEHGRLFLIIGIVFLLQLILFQ